MIKEIIITILLIVIFTTLAQMSTSFTHNTVDDTTKELSKVKNQIENEVDKEVIKKRVEEIYNKWENRENSLALYLEHNELRDVDELLQKIVGEVQAEPEDAISEINECIANLKYVEEKQLFNFKNLF